MSKKPRTLPSLLVADSSGRLMQHPSLKMAGRSGADLARVNLDDLIPLPEGSELFNLPGRTAFGYEEASDTFVPLESGPEGQEVWPMAAFMAPAHTATLLAAYRNKENAPRLPLFAYAAIGELDGQYWVCGERVDADQRQDPQLIDEREVRRKVALFLKNDGGNNRLIEHLSHCALDNHCAAAKNYFLERFEVPVPSSPQCNSDCVGCLSFQKPEVGFPSTQNRIGFTPTADEIAGVVLPHFAKSRHPVASFGQGCEGDPLMNPPLLVEAIQKIRASTKTGTININTNGSRPEVVRDLMKAGLDAIRVSMNSAQEPWYNAYYRPRGYTFRDIKESVRLVGAEGGKSSINYFVFPGVSDREKEIEALLKFIYETDLHLIQWRNLNLDPDLYLETLGDLESAGKALGVKALFKAVREKFPHVRYGYFNPAWNDEAENLSRRK
jgi:pyruvate-formate lyase-activating enzyme